MNYFNHLPLLSDSPFWTHCLRWTSYFINYSSINSSLFLVSLKNNYPGLLEEIQYCNLNFQSVLYLFYTSPGIKTIKKCPVVLCTNYLVQTLRPEGLIYKYNKWWNDKKRSFLFFFCLHCLGGWSPQCHLNVLSCKFLQFYRLIFSEYF